MSSGFLPIACYLIENCQIDINESSDIGFRALHVACNRDLYDIAGFLIKKGAHLNAFDATGKTALDVCTSKALWQLISNEGGRSAEDMGDHNGYFDDEINDTKETSIVVSNVQAPVRASDKLRKRDNIEEKNGITAIESPNRDENEVAPRRKSVNSVQDKIREINLKKGLVVSPPRLGGPMSRKKQSFDGRIEKEDERSIFSVSFNKDQSSFLLDKNDICDNSLNSICLSNHIEVGEENDNLGDTEGYLEVSKVDQNFREDETSSGTEAIPIESIDVIVENFPAINPTNTNSRMTNARSDTIVINEIAETDPTEPKLTSKFGSQNIIENNDQNDINDIDEVNYEKSDDYDAFNKSTNPKVNVDIEEIGDTENSENLGKRTLALQENLILEAKFAELQQIAQISVATALRLEQESKLHRQEMIAFSEELIKETNKRAALETELSLLRNACNLIDDEMKIAYANKTDLESGMSFALLELEKKIDILEKRVSLMPSIEFGKLIAKRFDSLIPNREEIKTLKIPMSSFISVGTMTVLTAKEIEIDCGRESVEKIPLKVVSQLNVEHEQRPLNSSAVTLTLQPPTSPLLPACIPPSLEGPSFLRSELFSLYRHLAILLEDPQGSIRQPSTSSNDASDSFLPLDPIQPQRPFEADWGWMETGCVIAEEVGSRESRRGRSNDDVLLSYEDIYPSSNDCLPGDLSTPELTLQSRSESFDSSTPTREANGKELFDNIYSPASYEVNPMNRSVSTCVSNIVNGRGKSEQDDQAADGISYLKDLNEINSSELEANSSNNLSYQSEQDMGAILDIPLHESDGEQNDGELDIDIIKNVVLLNYNGDEPEDMNENSSTKYVGKEIFQEEEEGDEVMMDKESESEESLESHDAEEVKEVDSTIDDANPFALDLNSTSRSYGDEDNLHQKLEEAMSTICSTLETVMIHIKQLTIARPFPRSILQQAQSSSEIERKAAKAEAWRHLAGHSLSKRDLYALGAIPIAIKPIIQHNEVALWAIFRCYCSANKTLHGISSGRNESRKKVLSLINMWNLLRDFNVCPHICSKMGLLDSVSAVTGDPSLRSFSSSSGSQTISNIDLLLSFDSFVKILWRISVDCLLTTSSASPRSRLVAVLICMERYTSSKWIFFLIFCLLILIIIIMLYLISSLYIIHLFIFLLLYNSEVNISLLEFYFSYEALHLFFETRDTLYFEHNDFFFSNFISILLLN